MDTSIHIYGHLSDGILHHIERENTLNGNRDQDFGQRFASHFRLFSVIFGYFRLFSVVTWLFFNGSFFKLWIKKSITMHSYAYQAHRIKEGVS